jgi:hypothetical protein
MLFAGEVATRKVIQMEAVASPPGQASNLKFKLTFRVQVSYTRGLICILTLNHISVAAHRP